MPPPVPPADHDVARGLVEGPTGLRAAAAVVASLAAAAALGLLWQSRSWPLVHDAPLMHYVAWRLLDGAVAYRDVFDMNLPGVYAIHALVLTTLGAGDLAFRALDVGVLALTGAGLLAALRSFGPWGGVAAAGLFALYHVAGGPWLAGQRDFQLCAALAWAAAGLVRATAAGAGLGPLAGAALAIGLAVWIKPHAGLLAVALGVAAWRRPARGRALLAVGVGLGLPAAVALGWLAATGGLGAFADILGGYLVPLYSRLGRAPLLDALRRHDFGALVLGGLGVWAVLGVAALGRARERGRLAVLLTGAAYGVLHFGLQGRGWEYHLYPLVLAGVALGGAGLGSALREQRRGLTAALLVVLAVTAGALWTTGRRNLAPAWIAAKAARVDRVAAALRPTVLAGGTVQVLDTTDGGIDALLRLRARQPTRFLYDFHFYHDVGHPYVRRLRVELMAALGAHPPAAVVLFEQGWPDGGYERVAGFPELAAWLETGYRLDEAGDGYRVYRRRAAGAPVGSGA